MSAWLIAFSVVFVVMVFASRRYQQEAKRYEASARAYRDEAKRYAAAGRAAFDQADAAYRDAISRVQEWSA